MFPRAPRLIFDRPTLREVIFQVRFTPVLKIERDPVPFQEQVRRLGFVLHELHSVSLAPLPLAADSALSRVEHVFSTADRRSTIVLTRDFVATSTTNYVGWSSFRPWIESAVGSVREDYAPAYATRIGLRYQNVIRRSSLDLGSTSWSELLRPELLGVSSVMPVESSRHEIRFRDRSSAIRGRLAHGILDEENEPVYVIDTDHFREGEMAFDEALNTLDSLHEQAWDAFAWCIQDRLKDAMKPKPEAS